MKDYPLHVRKAQKTFFNVMLNYWSEEFERLKDEVKSKNNFYQPELMQKLRREKKLANTRRNYYKEKSNENR